MWFGSSFLSLSIDILLLAVGCQDSQLESFVHKMAYEHLLLKSPLNWVDPPLSLQACFGLPAMSPWRIKQFLLATQHFKKHLYQNISMPFNGCVIKASASPPLSTALKYVYRGWFPN